MSAIQMEIDDKDLVAAKQFADLERLSIEEFARRALLAAVDGRKQLEYLKKRAEGADWQKFKAALAQVPDVPPISGDELPEGWENKH